MSSTLCPHHAAELEAEVLALRERQDRDYLDVLGEELGGEGGA